MTKGFLCDVGLFSSFSFFIFSIFVYSNHALYYQEKNLKILRLGHSRTNTACFHLQEASEVVKVIKARNRIELAKGWEEAEMGSC